MHPTNTPAALCLERATDADFRWLLGEAEPSRAVRIAPDLVSHAVLQIIRILPANWLMIVEREIVGIISLKADSGDLVEIGYGVASSRRERGHATAAVAALQRILAGHGVAAVVAETATDNLASQRVLVKNGFVATDQRLDSQDGLLIVWRADLAAAGMNADAERFQSKPQWSRKQP